MPSATFSENVTIEADPANVWDQLQEPDVWASLGPVQKVWDPIFDDGVLTGFTWSTDIGGKVYEGTGKAISHQRPDRYELLLDTSEMSGTGTVDFHIFCADSTLGKKGVHDTLIIATEGDAETSPF